MNLPKYDLFVHTARVPYISKICPDLLQYDYAPHLIIAQILGSHSHAMFQRYMKLYNLLLRKDIGTYH